MNKKKSVFVVYCIFVFVILVYQFYCKNSLAYFSIVASLGVVGLLMLFEHFISLVLSMFLKSSLKKIHNKAMSISLYLSCLFLLVSAVVSGFFVFSFDTYIILDDKVLPLDSAYYERVGDDKKTTIRVYGKGFFDRVSYFRERQAFNFCRDVKKDNIVFSIKVLCEVDLTDLSVVQVDDWVRSQGGHRTSIINVIDEVFKLAVENERVSRRFIKEEIGKRFLELNIPGEKEIGIKYLSFQVIL